jgi:hypothetical protein
MQNLVRVSKTKSEELPIAPATLYKWHHLKRYPEIFRKFGGFLFVDLKALEALIESAGKAN